MTFFEWVIFTKHISESSRDKLSVVVLLPEWVWPEKAINDSQFAPQNHFSLFTTFAQESNYRTCKGFCLVLQKIVQNTLQLVNWFFRNTIFPLMTAFNYDHQLVFSSCWFLHSCWLLDSGIGNSLCLLVQF